MALFLVRWWKTKFLSGYKQFTGLDDDDESVTSRKKKTTDHIKLKEMECGVSISETPDGKRRDPQEFSFTLYDFDGHGKITKDDIAGLVTTIYETLGSSVKVPHCGSKTIRVKLIVTPNPESNDKQFHVDPKRCSPINQWQNDFINYSPKQKKKKHSRRDSESSHYHEPQTKPTLSCGCCGHSKKRSSSFQKQQLLKILQANMEKNNLVFQSPRRYPAWQQEKDLKSPRPPPPVRPCEEPLGGRHHQKHKDREAEQARAMAQVVRWLEQEVLAPKKHHHVHEHVHHHYHHYQDPPVVA